MEKWKQSSNQIEATTVCRIQSTIILHFRFLQMFPLIHSDMIMMFAVLPSALACSSFCNRMVACRTSPQAVGANKQMNQTYWHEEEEEEEEAPSNCRIKQWARGKCQTRRLLWSLSHYTNIHIRLYIRIAQEFSPGSRPLLCLPIIISLLLCGPISHSDHCTMYSFCRYMTSPTATDRPTHCDLPSVWQRQPTHFLEKKAIHEWDWRED